MKQMMYNIYDYGAAGGHKTPLGAYAQTCENVTVTNYVLSTPCNAIRVGVGNGDIVEQSSRAISVVSRD